MFDLHTQLMKDCAVVGDLPLCRVLLMDDRRFPWLILVPRREAITELFELGLADQQLLMAEVSATAAALAGRVRADKMNVAALGNIVPQLHIHVVARRQQDAAWPHPVWGRGSAEPYDDAARAELLLALTELLQPIDLQPA